MSSVTPEVYDLLILVDATGSMTSYLASLQTSLPQIITISTLTDCFARIGLLAYRDYTATGDLLEWSGWLSPSTVGSPTVDLIAKAKGLRPCGNTDTPEASKTGLARAYELMRADATTIVLLYTDAPPHTLSTGNMASHRSCLGAEMKALNDEKIYGHYGKHFADWVSASKWMSGRCGNKKAQVFSILSPHLGQDGASYYHYLSAMTNGLSFSFTDSMPSNFSPATISKITVELLLSWMGVEKAGATTTVDLPLQLATYKSQEGLETLKSELDVAAAEFFQTISDRSYGLNLRANTDRLRVSTDILKKHVPKKTHPVQDFAKRYNVDEHYKKIAMQQLKEIIEDDVSAISLNPVFGSLWRAVCNDRLNENRDEVLNAFGLQVDRIQNPTEKARMKEWLEESYDYSADVKDAIDSIPVELRFPCVCLDPTLTFTLATDGTDDEDEVNKPITDFRRDELLEIGRSCDYRILRRLGRLLTRLTFINSAEEMPAHIAAASQTDYPKIPLALASPNYKRKFWRILLHIVVPGTMLGARPAALLAALSIRLGVTPLLPAADQEMLLWKEKWNNIEVPETWNVSCISLLLDADEAYKKRTVDVSDERPAKRICIKGLLITSSKTKTSNNTESKSLLKETDRTLFSRLVSYKMLELNLDTTLTARIGWTPEKTSVPIGPTIVCKSCDYPRSVTLMGEDRMCGLCLVTTFEPGEREVAVSTRVNKSDNKDTLATWVECNLRTCRAHYVVYNLDRLNVKAKCHYCRIGKVAPVVECSGCLNRVIYPEYLRPNDMASFKCYACQNGRKTTVDVETTAKILSLENSTKWLLRNDNKKIPEPFNGRSLFHTISTIGTEDFCKNVELLPPTSGNDLRLQGKSVRNSQTLIAELNKWVSHRRTESGTCSLCFSNARKSDLLWACGRSGCTQRICKDCSKGWYGLNSPGRIINISALSCPFCRRAPTARTLAKYGMGIHAVGDLKIAVEERGAWIFAWCNGCGHAKPYIERVCAAGAPEELKDWSCEDCSVGNGDEKIKACPGCGTMTEKVSGCDHITCTVGGCGAHWCFYCGKEESESTIYSHMNEEHGGFYGGAGAEDYDSENEYEDD